MARTFDGIEERLERLDSDEHLAQFDSKVRLLKTDSGSANLVRNSEADDPLGRLVSLMEVLGRRLDTLDRKNRSLSDEIRQRDRRERRRRRSILAVVAVFVAMALGGWATTRFDHPVTAALRMP